MNITEPTPVTTATPVSAVASVGSETGIWENIKMKLHLDELFAKITDSRETIINVIIFCALGFGMGYLLKRYSSFFITCALVIAGIVILAQFDLLMISINWSHAYNLAGIPQAGTVTTESFFLTGWDMIKNNVPLSISFFVGFLVGLKTG